MELKGLYALVELMAKQSLQWTLKFPRFGGYLLITQAKLECVFPFLVQDARQFCLQIFPEVRQRLSRFVLRRRKTIDH